MGKYDPLYDYLRRKTEPELTMTFRHLELVLRAMLPNRANQAEWWTEGRGGDAKAPQNIAWQKAGYDAFLIAGDKVIFRRRN